MCLWRMRMPHPSQPNRGMIIRRKILLNYGVNPILLFARLSRVSFASVITSRVIITTDYRVLERITEHASVANVFANPAGRVPIVPAETALTLAFLLVGFINLWNFVHGLMEIFLFYIGGGEICSGKGDCVCGECQCFEEDGGRYSGKYCEECPVGLSSA